MHMYWNFNRKGMKREILISFPQMQTRWFTGGGYDSKVDDASMCAREGNGEPTNCVTGQLLQVENLGISPPGQPGFLCQRKLDFSARTVEIFM